MDERKRKRRRTIMASDADWERIGARARAAGLPVSRYVVTRLTVGDDRPPPTPSGPPAALPRRVAREVIALGIAERRRFEAEDAGVAWEDILALAEDILAREEDAG